DRRRTDSLWFALQTLTASVLPLYYLGATQLAFGRYDVSAVGIALTAAAITGVYFTHKRFGLPLHGRVWNTVMLVSTVVALALADPFEVLLIARLTVLTVAGVCIHQIVLLGRRVLQGGRSGEAWILAAWIAIALTAWCDMFAWFGIGEPLGGIRLSGFGLFFFAGLQALSLSRDHIRLLNRSDLLNEELAARVSELETRQAEIELLNHELRRQIADRSGRLVAALRLAAEDPQTPTLQPGDVINERYKVVRELGRGGMGAVHEVIRQADGKHLALKVARCLDGLDIARLAREAEIAAQVVHPNIVAIVDVDISATGFLYVVMELAEGTTLQKVGDQDVRWSLEVLAQVAEGLAALHDAGVIHRDLKPSNVIVAKGPHAKITDFGISRLVTHDSIPPSSSVTGETATSRKATTSAEPAESEDAEQDSTLVLSGARSREPLTQTGMLTGTPRYLAPELVESEALSLASDIFSFGVVAFELLAETPFAEPPALAILQEREPTRCGSLSEVALSPHVRELLERCLSLSPENRPAPDELARALRSPPAIASDAEIYGALDATRVGDR
ncbi:MAG: protein kinase, partial [Myxococcota bacterium]